VKKKRGAEAPPLFRSDRGDITYIEFGASGKVV